MSHVIVVGAGIAGLACAYQLDREGHEVEVLESSVVSGGSVRTERLAGFRLERGARWFERTTSTDALLSALRLGDVVVPVDVASKELGADGYRDPTHHAEPMPGEPALAAGRFSLEKGMGQWTRALADGLTVRLGWGVEAIEADALGVRVHYIAPSGERTLRAEAAVLAIPATSARKLGAACGALAEPRESGGRCGVVHLLAGAALDREAAVRVSPDAGVSLAGWTSASSAEGHMLRVVVGDDAAGRLWKATDAEWADYVLGQLARTPVGKPEVETSVVDRFVLPAPDGSRVDVIDASRRLVFGGGAVSIADAVARGVAAAAQIERVPWRD